MANSLYICYFGLRQPLVQTQVLPYLRELTKFGHSITLLTFEPDLKSEWTAEQARDTKAAMQAEGIDWEHLAYHKRPSAVATAYDIFRGAIGVRKIIREKKIDILHGRVHVPTLMGALGRKLSVRKPKLLFDIRGFFPEEYTDAGIWPANGLLYRSAKRIEKWLMREADGFVVLTEKARGILFGEDASPGHRSAEEQGQASAANPKPEIPNPKSTSRPIEVIPCCVDMEKFAAANSTSRDEVRERLGVRDRYVVAYVGAFGGWYLTEETADFFGSLRRNRADGFALILTQSDPEMIEPLLRERGYADKDFFITRVPPDEIPRYLSAADAAVSFIMASYSKQASSPTKNAEYLACGLPIIANRGVGDVDLLIEENGVGALVDSFSDNEFLRALDAVEALGDIDAKCRATARKFFDLATVGGRRYRRLYERLMSNGQ